MIQTGFARRRRIQIRGGLVERECSQERRSRSVNAMTLFWHNHFATSIAKIQDARLMQTQNDLIRKHALGRFGTFLKEMSRDPAMLIWLDSESECQNRAPKRENYAREVMELFSPSAWAITPIERRSGSKRALFTGWHVSVP